MSWQEAVAEYIRQKISEVEWDEREFIDSLVTIEEYLLRGGPHSYAEALKWRHLSRTYPADVRAIRQELDHLRTADPGKFQAMVDEKVQQRARRRAQADAAAKAAAALQEAEKRLWVSAGGRP